MRCRNRIIDTWVGPLTRIEFPASKRTQRAGEGRAAETEVIENGWLAGPDQDLKHQAEFVLMKWTQPSSHTRLARGKMGGVGSATHTHRQEEGRGVMHITTLGIDLAKNVFQLHGVDARGRAVLSRRVKRSQLLHAVASLPPCVMGMEACGSAHVGWRRSTLAWNIG